MKKVTIVHHFGGLGGAGNSLINNVKKLREVCDLTVVVPEFPPDMYDHLAKIEGISILKCKFIPSFPVYSGGLGLFSLKLYLLLVKSFIKRKEFTDVVDRSNPDVLIVNSLILSWVSWIYPHIKTICFVRETRKSSIASCIHSQFLKKFSLVVFLSRFDRDSWQGIGSAFINENFYEGDSLSKKNFECAPSNQGLRVLFLGGSSYIKGFYFLLLSSIFYRSSRKLEISVLGNVSFIATQLVKLFSKGTVFFQIYGYQKNPAKFYIRSDLVVFPVVRVHQARPLFEAGFYEKTVLLPDYENFKEFNSNQNLLLFKKGSLIGFARQLEFAAENKDNLSSIGARNYEVYEAKHSPLAAEKRFVELKYLILEARPNPKCKT